MQRLTHYGIALHGGRLPGYPASHGCIRLPHSFARRLYNLTDFSSRVIVTRARPRSTRQALDLAV
jgi:lipoprotein-anchoring transpeptidase ErfK/SrfK